MLTDPKSNPIKLSSYLNRMVSEIQSPQQLQAVKQELMNLTNNDPQIKANNLQFIPLGVANSLANHPMNQPAQGTTKDAIESKLMGMNAQPPGPQNIPPPNSPQAQAMGSLNAPPQPPQPGNSGIAALPQSNPQGFKQGGVTKLAGGGFGNLSDLFQQAQNKVENYNPTGPTNPLDIEKQVAASRPDYAEALNKPIGQSLMDTLAETMQERKALQAEQLGSQSQQQHQMDISNALAAAANATRGRGNGLSGIAEALLGGTTYLNKAQANETARQNTLKSQAIEQKLADAKIKDLVEERRIAAANNDVAKMITYDKDIRDLQNQKGMLGITSLQAMFNPMATIEHAKMTAAATMNAANKPTDTMRNVHELMAQSAKDGKAMTYEEALNKVKQLDATGQYMSAQQREQKDLFDKIQTLKAGVAPFLMQMDKNDPDSQKQRQVIEDNLQKAIQDTIDEYKKSHAAISGTAQPAPDVNTPTGGFGQATRIPK